MFRSGYYKRKDRPLCDRQRENEEIVKRMGKSCKENRGICGLDKMLEGDREAFPSCSRNRVYRLQREYRFLLVERRNVRF